MSINYAILGILSCKPLTGYDLKKIIQDSPFMYWSGNNNQIYKVLVELLEEGWATSEILHQESSPSKKVYTITKKGLSALKEWVLSSPEPPEFKKPFLIRLAWSDQLSAGELDALLAGYENDMKIQLLLEQEKLRRKPFSPGRTQREAYLWDMINENVLSSYRNELDWVKRVRQELNCDHKESDKMDYRVVEKDGARYIELAASEKPISKEQDILDVIAACTENDIALVMLHSGALSADFFRLGTGLAGHVLQKLANYRVKTAIVLAEGQKLTGKFRELSAEAGKGSDFRVFSNTDEAESWLLGKE